MFKLKKTALGFQNRIFVRTKTLVNSLNESLTSKLRLYNDAILTPNPYKQLISNKKYTSQFSIPFLLKIVIFLNFKIMNSFFSIIS